MLRLAAGSVYGCVSAYVCAYVLEWNTPMCHTYAPYLCATPMCNTCVPHLCATLMCHTYVQHLRATPMCHTYVPHLRATPACHTCVPHLRAILMCQTCVPHLRATLMCNTCVPHLCATPMCHTYVLEWIKPMLPSRFLHLAHPLIHLHVSTCGYRTQPHRPPKLPSRLNRRHINATLKARQC